MSGLLSDPYMDIMNHGGGLLGMQQTANKVLKEANEYRKSLHPMDQAALATAPIPLLGDVTGLAADARMYAQEPEQRNWMNYGLSALGALPFVPSLGMIKAYHGTAAPINKFDDAMRGSTTKANSARKAHWFVSDPKTAEGYADYAAKDARVQKLIDDSYAAERANKWDDASDLMRQAEELENHLISNPQAGQNIIPVELDETKLYNVDAEGQNWGQLDDNQVDKWLDQAKEDGYNGLQIENFSDEADYGIDNPQTHYAIFNSENINSPFEPKQGLLGDGVKINNAAISIDGKIIEAPTHGQAINIGIKNGDIFQNADGHYISKDGTDLAFDGASLDLFMTSEGNLIDRFQASKLFGISAAEDIK